MSEREVLTARMHAGRSAATVRQISNPMAATDCTLLALAGIGHAGGRAFGFASCNRTLGASEGMNVLARRRRRCGSGNWEYEYGVTNVEYTEFQRLGLEDKATECGTESLFPANTNILYVGAPSVYSWPCFAAQYPSQSTPTSCTSARPGCC
jgi:UTP---glucose-1-phosphate uridylyltransferase